MFMMTVGVGMCLIVCDTGLDGLDWNGAVERVCCCQFRYRTGLFRLSWTRAVKCRVPVPALNSTPVSTNPWISENWKSPWIVLEKRVEGLEILEFVYHETYLRLMRIKIWRQSVWFYPLYSCELWWATVLCIIHMRWAGFGRFIIALDVWVIDWTKGLEFALNCWMKWLWKALIFLKDFWHRNLVSECVHAVCREKDECRKNEGNVRL